MPRTAWKPDFRADGTPSGDGISTAESDPFEPDEIGTWCFRGEYSGDENYPAPAPGEPAAIDASATECFDVVDTSSILTDQTWVPKDTATVTSGGGSPLTGTLTITLYDNATCDGAVLYEESFTLTDEASPASRTTTNGDGTDEPDVVFDEADSTVNVSWKAVFDSATDSADSEGPCETSTGLAIDDNDPAP